MAENSKISWTEHTFNPWVGCEPVSPGCANCYAKAWAKRTGQANLWEGVRRVTAPANWAKVQKWQRAAANARRVDRVFCASSADVFEDFAGVVENSEALENARRSLWQLIEQTPNLLWMLLTKRPENVEAFIPKTWGFTGWPENIILGATIENQQQLTKRRAWLTELWGIVPLFASCEPLLGPLDFGPHLQIFNQVICGGESGGRARPMSPKWARQLRDDCARAGVSFHFKQWGAWSPEANGGKASDYVDFYGDDSREHHRLVRIGNQARNEQPGHLLDGQAHLDPPPYLATYTAALIGGVEAVREALGRNNGNWSEDIVTERGPA